MQREPVPSNPSSGRDSIATPLTLRGSQFFVALLLAVHGLLIAIGVIGLMEWFGFEPPWPRISNPLFSRAMLAFEWLLMLTAGVLFIAGYRLKWRYTPLAMTVVYAAMAATCAVQTFGILVHESRFREMAIEYAEYAIILWFLFRSRAMRLRFGMTPMGQP